MFPLSRNFPKFAAAGAVVAFSHTRSKEILAAADPGASCKRGERYAY
jgi:hypothetical protein